MIIQLPYYLEQLNNPVNLMLPSETQFSKLLANYFKCQAPYMNPLETKLTILITASAF